MHAGLKLGCDWKKPFIKALTLYWTTGTQDSVVQHTLPGIKILSAPSILWNQLRLTVAVPTRMFDDDGHAMEKLYWDCGKNGGTVAAVLQAGTETCTLVTSVRAEPVASEATTWKATVCGPWRLPIARISPPLETVKVLVPCMVYVIPLPVACKGSCSKIATARETCCRLILFNRGCRKILPLLSLYSGQSARQNLQFFESAIFLNQGLLFCVILHKYNAKLHRLVRYFWRRYTSLHQSDAKTKSVSLKIVVFNKNPKRNVEHRLTRTEKNFRVKFLSLSSLSYSKAFL